MQYFPDILNIRSRGSINKVIFNMLIIHLLLVFFMVPIRSIFFDTIFYRDIILLIMLVLFAGIISLNKRRRRINNIMDKIIIYYLCLGAVVILFFILYSRVNPLTAIIEYRNHFFPFFLFFISRAIITDFRLRIKISNLFFIMFLILSLSTLCEYLLINIIDFSPYNIPWYEYTFLNSDRYIGNNTNSAIGYINPSQTPILGILGWPHATAAVLMCLLGFNYPFMMSSKGHKTSKLLIVNRFPQLFNYALIFITAFVIISVLKVKMHILTLTFLLILFPTIISKTNVMKSVLITSIITLLIYNIDLLKYIIIESVISGYIGSEIRVSTLSVIFNIDPLLILGNLTPVSIFFGDYSAIVTGEFRILNYTLRFGIFWLILYMSILLVVFKKMKSCIKDNKLFLSDKYFITGVIYLLLISYIDMAHYARAMTWPIIDLMAIILGCLSPFFNYVNFQNSQIRKG